MPTAPSTTKPKRTRSEYVMAIAVRHAEQIVRMYLSDLMISVREVAREFGLPQYAVHAVIEEYQVTELYDELHAAMMERARESGDEEAARYVRVKDGRAACGARCRAGGYCQARPTRNRNGRCRMHGGLSTGPKTTEGREKARAAVKARWQRYYAEKAAEAAATV